MGEKKNGVIFFFRKNLKVKINFSKGNVARAKKNLSPYEVPCPKNFDFEGVKRGTLQANFFNFAVFATAFATTCPVPQLPMEHWRDLERARGKCPHDFQISLICLKFF